MKNVIGACMPKIYYEEKEHRDIVSELQENSLILSQKLCMTTGLGCILIEEKREYCCSCPAIEECPYEFKSLPK
jgi:hypothetical protein